LCSERFSRLNARDLPLGTPPYAMKIQFDSNQQFQIDAVNAVVDLFDGQPKTAGIVAEQFQPAGELYEAQAYPNALTLADETLLENLRIVQRRNGIAEADNLDSAAFTIEMETGTGKTYVYLRTIFELNVRYGFTKFIVVVPSVAIREGVKQSIDLTREHFASLYGNPQVSAWVYDSKQASKVRDFASSTAIQVMIINIDAFKKAETIMNRDNDAMSGFRPIDFVRATKPIVIIDEPQKLNSEVSKAAISSLRPSFTASYSATPPKDSVRVYRLGPVQAYDLNLVKRIEVDSVLDESDFNQPFIRVVSISATRSRITVSLEMDVHGASGVARKVVRVDSPGTKLSELSGRSIYDGYVVEEINASSGYVAFANGMVIEIGQSHGDNKDAVMRAQVFETVKEHLDREVNVHRTLPVGRRVKVLSLFFIDRVANYYDEDGKIRRMFVDAYSSLAQRARYSGLGLPPVESVHNGYFAQTKSTKKDAGTPKDSTEGRATAADDEAFELIMRDKQRLMSLNEPLRFIFSHSALREGWDNPNVFQICTLNETRSETQKRQEIGRGLRLPVDETGVRVFSADIARLTVIANESYKEFAASLQKEIETETGEKFGSRIENRKERIERNLVPGWSKNEYFRDLWGRIKHRTRYSVHYSTDDLTRTAAEYIHRLPEIAPPKITIQRGSLATTSHGVTTTLRSAGAGETEQRRPRVPDVLGYLQRETKLARTTLAAILGRSGRSGDILVNPQVFLDLASRAINYARHDLMVDGIKYEKRVDEETEWDMLLFELRELDGYSNRLVPVTRSIFDAIECDSQTERKFAVGLDGRDDIKLFLKLPRWFEIDTPLGKYRPDWAIVKQTSDDDARLYLVRETKSTSNQFAIRPTEEGKITCGKAHFDALGGVDFAKVTDPASV
jgi:type III restriction enzyme